MRRFLAHTSPSSFSLVNLSFKVGAHQEPILYDFFRLYRPIQVTRIPL